MKVTKNWATPKYEMGNLAKENKAFVARLGEVLNRKRVNKRTNYWPSGCERSDKSILIYRTIQEMVEKTSPEERALILDTIEEVLGEKQEWYFEDVCYFCNNKKGKCSLEDHPLAEKYCHRKGSYIVHGAI